MKRDQTQNGGRKPLWKPIVCCLLAAALAVCSAFPLKTYSTDADNFAASIASIDQRKATVTGLSAAAAAAATAVAAIPGDATTPIAEQIMDISSYLLLVVCVLVLEKSLIAAVGGVSFGLLLPAACAIFIVWVLSKKQWLFQLALKLAVFALVLALIIPCSVWVSDRVYEANKTSVEEVVQAQPQPDGEQAQQEKSWWQNALSAVKGGAEDLKQEAQRILNRFIDAIAIFLITYCAIPILVLMAVLWLLKMFFGLDIPAPGRLPKLPHPHAHRRGDGAPPSPQA